jgi:hypothetical protein
MLVGELCWEPFSVAVESIWAVWLKQWQTMPNWLNIDPVWLPIGQNSSRLFCLTVACNNPDQAACTNALAPYRAVTGTTIDSLKFQPFLNWQMANVNVSAARTSRSPPALTPDPATAAYAFATQCIRFVKSYLREKSRLFAEASAFPRSMHRTVHPRFKGMVLWMVRQDSVQRDLRAGTL